MCPQAHAHPPYDCQRGLIRTQADCLAHDRFLPVGVRTHRAGLPLFTPMRAPEPGADQAEDIAAPSSTTCGPQSSANPRGVQYLLRLSGRATTVSRIGEAHSSPSPPSDCASSPPLAMLTPLLELHLTKTSARTDKTVHRWLETRAVATSLTASRPGPSTPRGCIANGQLHLRCGHRPPWQERAAPGTDGGSAGSGLLRESAVTTAWAMGLPALNMFRTLCTVLGHDTFGAAAAETSHGYLTACQMLRPFHSCRSR